MTLNKVIGGIVVILMMLLLTLMVIHHWHYEPEDPIAHPDQYAESIERWVRQNGR